MSLSTRLMGFRSEFLREFRELSSSILPELAPFGFSDTCCWFVGDRIPRRELPGCFLLEESRGIEIREGLWKDVPFGVFMKFESLDCGETRVLMKWFSLGWSEESLRRL